jgi:hypothetical protein
MDVTADFIYCRLHGPEEIYASGYDDKSMAFWQKNVAAWAKGSEPANAQRIGRRVPRDKNGRDVFVYFDNDLKVRAPYDAMRLAKLFGFDGNAEMTKESQAQKETVTRVMEKRKARKSQTSTGKKVTSRKQEIAAGTIRRRSESGDAGAKS